MEQRIIYQNNDNSISIITPADCGLTIEEIALKDVPYRKPFKIVDVSDLPTDRTQRKAWFVDKSELTDGFGADYGAGSNNLFIMKKV